MTPSRPSLLKLLEETYGRKHPAFDSIRWQFERIIRKSEEIRKEKDVKLLLAGMYAAKHTYEDWGELSDHEKESALKAIEQVRDTTTLLVERHDIDIHVR